MHVMHVMKVPIACDLSSAVSALLVVFVSRSGSPFTVLPQFLAGSEGPVAGAKLLKMDGAYTIGTLGTLRVEQFDLKHPLKLEITDEMGNTINPTITERTMMHCDY